LKADSGVELQSTNKGVITWFDQSGNGNDANLGSANNQPYHITNAFNGKAVVRFYGSNYFNLPNTLLSGTTGAEAFVVLKAAADVPSTARSLWKLGGTGNTTAYPNTSGNIIDDFGSTSLHTLGNPEQPLDQYHVYEVAGQTNYWSAWLNGKVQSITTTNTYGTNGSPTLGYSSSSGYYFAGDVAEVLMFNKVLSSDERDTVNGFLNLKYGLIPQVSITSPTNDAIHAAGSDINIIANATEASGGTIKQVQFFEGTNSIGISSNLPYSVIWTNVSAGAYALTAQATGVNGLTSTSSVVNISMHLPPTVSITSPTNNEDFGMEPVDVTINATANSSFGISRVQFFGGATSLGITTNSPYSFTWNGVTAGNYFLTAVALDNDGLSTTSSVVNVSVAIRDTDNDGLSDVQESLYGTNPNTADSFWIWISTPGGGLIP
jgi:hypothetical protein